MCNLREWGKCGREVVIGCWWWRGESEWRHDEKVAVVAVVVVVEGLVVCREKRRRGKEWRERELKVGVRKW